MELVRVSKVGHAFFYERIVEVKVTNSFVAEWPLEPSDVEHFRVNPQDFLETYQGDIEPDAA